MRPRNTTGGSKDLSDHLASGRSSYNKALLSGNFSAMLQNCRRARSSLSASGTKRTDAGRRSEKHTSTSHRNNLFPVKMTLRVSDSNYPAAWLSSATRIAASIFSGVVIGAKRLSGVPSRPIRNLVKFHLMRPPSTPGSSSFR